MASAEPTSVKYDERSQSLVRESRNRRREVSWILKLQTGDLHCELAERDWDGKDSLRLTVRWPNVSRVRIA